VRIDYTYRHGVRYRINKAVASIDANLICIYIIITVATLVVMLVKPPYSQDSAQLRFGRDDDDKQLQ
jgi:hypothetical protein